MPVLNRIAAFAEDMTAWRQHLHANPELGFACHATADFIVQRLQEFGIDQIETGIAETGLVAVIEGQEPGPVIGLRADMDALPIEEETGLKYGSQVPGRMHACGHDGHVTMLLGAARYLSEARAFRGKAALIFQPAEENGAGGEVMVQEGIMERFGIEQVFAMHNSPGLPEGEIFTTPGPILAAADTIEIWLDGAGGHGALPARSRDPIPGAVALVQALQTIVSRNITAQDELVISVTQIHAGTADNIIPESCYICGTVRSFAPEMRDLAERRCAEIAEGIAAAHNLAARVVYTRGYPATVNTPDEAAFAADVAADVVGEDRVDAEFGRDMGAEDFAYMLEARPGAYLLLGAGEGPSLHNPGFDFNDRITPIGASLFARLVERAQPL
ncbi:MAG: M20 aminoacylase family protein [Pseudomonadota bacterium]